MLGHGLKSPLYQEIREKKGLVYYVRCGINRLTYKSGVLQFSCETSRANVDEFQLTLKEILDNPDKYMTKERFDIIKDAIKISIKMSKINRYSDIGKYITPIEWQIEPILEDLTYDEVMSYYDKYFKFENLYLSVDLNEEWK